MLTKTQLKKVYPDAPAADIDAFIASEQAMTDAGIYAGRNRLHFFLAQLGHESAGLTRREENLNYSAARLMAVWPARFPDLTFAGKYANNPEKLGNFVYGDRLGNTKTGDGYKYRGRGYIQITGRENYREVGKLAGLTLEENPDLAAQAKNAVKIACAYWKRTKLNPLCDSGDFVGVTKKINGGTNGLQDRFEWLADVQAFVPWPAGAKNAVTDEIIRLAQTKLKKLMFYSGSIDGIIGERTAASLRAFQAQEGLEVTGDLDPATREALNV